MTSSASILVTGGAGFLGSRIGSALADSGMMPVLFDIASEPPFSGNRAIYRQGDLLDGVSLRRCISECSVRRIIHAAFVTEPLMGYADEELADHIRFNIAGTIAVCEAAVSAGLGIIFISSKAVYGPLRAVSPDELPQLREDKPKSPIALYGSTKLVCEQMLKVYSNVAELDFAIVRFATLWGPGKAQRYASLAPHSRMVEAAVRRESCRIERGADQLDDMLYVKDAACNIVKLALQPRLGGEDFNFGTGTARRFCEVATILQRMFPGWRADVGSGCDYFGVGPETAAYCLVDTTKARHGFGFEVRYDLESALADYAAEITK